MAVVVLWREAVAEEAFDEDVLVVEEEHCAGWGVELAWVGGWVL